MIKIKNKSLLSVLMVILLFISIRSRADDGAFLSSGDQLFPLEETTIELRHEILRFHYNDEKDQMEVDVMFEFYNPGPKKNLLVGFVTPAGTQDEESYVLNPIGKFNPKPYINDFKIFKDGQMLPFECKLKYKGEEFSILNGDTIRQPDYWAYSFNTTFDTGTNIIYHSYSYDGDYSNIGLRDFSYRLSTGCLWANKEIGKLELFIDAGTNKLFAVPLTFDSKAHNPVHWETIGLLKSHIDTTIDINACIKSLYCFSKGGYLHLSQEHFKASIDLNIALLNAQLYNSQEGLKMNWFNIPELDDYPGCSPIDSTILKQFNFDYKSIITGSTIDSIVSLNLHQLTILKNIPFALAGYDFKNPELKAYFNQFIWYFPDPNVPDSYDILTPVQQKLVSYVLDQIKLLTKK